MSKFLCNGAIEFPADKIDVVSSVLQKHGLEDPYFKKECRIKGEKATYFLEESYCIPYDKDTFKEAFWELSDQNIYMVVNIVYYVEGGDGENYALRTRNGKIYDLGPDELTIWNADTEDLIKELEARGITCYAMPVQPNDAPEFIGQMIDAVEDFLEEKGVTIDNPEKEEEEGDENTAILYGSDYDALADAFRNLMRAYHFISDEDGKVLIHYCDDKDGSVYEPVFIGPKLFRFYIRQRRAFTDGTSSWDLCCQLTCDPDKRLPLEIVCGSRADAVARLEKIVSTGDLINR